MKRVVFLGTSAATPTKTRNVTAHALELLNGKLFLLDCGEGTQHRFLISELKPSKISCIFITHLHGDHLFGLPGLMASMSLLAGDSKEVVKIFGPEGLKNYLLTSLNSSSTYITFKYEVVELKAEESKVLGTFSDVTVTAFPLVHKVTCFGYLFQEADKPGALNAKKAMELGAKSSQLGLLKAGKDVTLDNGNIITASSVIGPTKKGKKVILLGDTSDSSSIINYFSNLPDKDSEEAGCDLVVHEVTYDASKKEKAVEGGHSTSEMAGEFAKKVKAKKLIITHFSQMYTVSRANTTTKSDDPKALSVDDLVNETQAACGEYTKVYAAEDLKGYEIEDKTK